MKVQVPTTKEIDIRYITLELPCNYDDEDIPYDAPLRENDIWKAAVHIETGIIEKWPQGQKLNLYMKVCDEGLYKLYDKDWVELGCVQGYVPHGVVPGEYGDYVELNIDEFGVITNWPRKPQFNQFWPDVDAS